MCYLKFFSVGLVVAISSSLAQATPYVGGENSSLPSGVIFVQAAPAIAPQPVARAVHVIITGNVTGVGYRNWAVRTAKTLNIRGWVKNVGKTVEALIGGSEDAVTAMLAACRKGPSGASVRDVTVTPADVTKVPADFKRLN